MKATEAQVAFWFKQTGARFEKDGKIYRVPRRHQHSQAQNGIENPGNVTAPDPERLVLGTLYENLEPDCPDLNSGYPVNS